MIRALLLDLDGTLLENPMQTFLPAYFRLLGESLAPLIPPDRLTRALVDATNEVMAHPDPVRTNMERFWDAFQRITGYERDAVKPLADRFYVDRFPELAAYVTRKPEAEPLVRLAFERGLEVVIATNPLFPRLAVEHRLAWAGVPVDRFPYTLVTTYENMHACKPHLAYFEEILATVGCAPEEALMVGDELELDMTARQLGIHTFLVNEGEETVSSPLVERQGSLRDLLEWLGDGLS